MRRISVLGLYCDRSCRVWRRSWSRMSASASGCGPAAWAAWVCTCTPTTFRMRPGMSAGKATRSAQPALMALLGMESNCAESGCCTNVRPPWDLIACRPNVPSDPMPDNTTPMARSPSARASELKSTSMGKRWPRGCDGAARCSRPPCTLNSALGGITYTVLGSMRCESTASYTGIAVARCSNSPNCALCVGSMCCTTT